MAKNDATILKVLSKLDALDERLNSVDKTLIKQEANLGEHMRRTDLAEKSIEGIKSDMEPIKKHVAYVEGALKGLGVVAMMVTIISGLLKIIHVI